MRSLDPRSSTLDPPIGLLGGSFDPIHVGHLQLARDARDRLGLAEVRLIPAAQPWQKGPLTDAAQRAHMVRLAIAGEPGLVLDMHEVERGGPSYTIDTLRALRAVVGPAQPLVLILGADQMARLDTWREWRSLLDYAHIAVAHRDAQPPQLGPSLQAFHDAHHADRGALRARPQGALVDLPMTPVDASATEVRALLSESPSPARDARLAALVPAAVLHYIRRRGLYTPHAQLAPREKVNPLSMDLQKLQRVVVDALEDVKAQDIRVFNTVGQSDMFDRVILASGGSNRQTRALAWSVVEKVKASGGQVVSVEGTDPGEWVLVDLGDVVVHIMQPAIREYYGLEEMWGSKPVKVKLAADRRANRPEAEPVAAAAIEAAAAPSPRQAPAKQATNAAAKKAAAAPTAPRRASVAKDAAAQAAAAEAKGRRSRTAKQVAPTKAATKRVAAKQSTAGTRSSAKASTASRPPRKAPAQTASAGKTVKKAKAAPKTRAVTSSRKATTARAAKTTSRSAGTTPIRSARAGTASKRASTAKRPAAARPAAEVVARKAAAAKKPAPRRRAR
jgi:nicotinate (nicotinamide) nucleotide adenylyltransferase/ribosome silencing factor RsfS/YbeB/iojap